MPEQVSDSSAFSTLSKLRQDLDSDVCLPSSHTSLPDWGLNFVSIYSWQHPCSTGSLKQQADITMASNTLLDIALKPRDFVENISSLY